MSPLALIAVQLAFGAAPTTRLAILPTVVDGPHGAASAGEVFEAARRGVGVRLELETLGYDALFLQGATSRVTEAARCGSDEACVIRVLGEAGAELGLRVVTNFALEPPLVTVSLLSVDADVPARSAVRQADASGWARALEQACAQLLEEAGSQPAGRLVVRTEPADLTVEVLGPGPARREGPGVFRVAPGRHRVRAVDASGRAVDGAAVITAHQTTELPLVLGPPPAAVAEDDGSVLGTWWFWTGVGVLAAGAATAALIAADPFGGGSTPGCVCVTTPAGPCGSCPGP